jgi:hypothetical protein
MTTTNSDIYRIEQGVMTEYVRRHQVLPSILAFPRFGGQLVKQQLTAAAFVGFAGADTRIPVERYSPKWSDVAAGCRRPQ